MTDIYLAYLMRAWPIMFTCARSQANTGVLGMRVHIIGHARNNM
eukprot:COSAG05_NODE_57_length_23291_cov_75.862668_41_plen_44_part_00